jgi:osmotically-inducible protein OsmY
MRRLVQSLSLISSLLIPTAGGAAGTTDPSAGASAQEAQTAELKLDRKVQRSDDRALAKRVLVSLSHNKNLDMDDVTVLAHAGTVTLIGNVPELEQVAVAETSASRVEGVLKVQNNLIGVFHGR